MNKARLYRVMDSFLEDLQPKYILDDLLEKNVVTEEEKECLLSMVKKNDSSQKQVEQLFEILSAKGSKELDNFINVLNLEDKSGMYYPWLAEKLGETNFTLEIGKRKNLKDNVRKLLTDGGVPFQPRCLIDRQSKIKEIREKLMQASNSSHISSSWVALHGMSGTGKSVLAVEALIDNELIERHFNDGVFWMTLGCLNDENALGIKMEKLYQKILDAMKDVESERKKDLLREKERSRDFLESKCNPAEENLNDLTQNLKQLVVNKKILLVFDDLWENPKFNVVEKLNIGCTILVTTKFPGAFDDCSQYCKKIECKNDLPLDESRKLLALYVDCKVDALPPIVTSICEECKGSPFTLSHIGRWMAPFGNDSENWKYLKRLLDKGLRSAIRQRHSSNDQLNEMKKIVKLTLEPIEKHKDLFYDFVIFPQDEEWIPIQVFTVLWNKNSCEVRIDIDRLVRSSLVQCQQDPIYSYSYGIHDLYLELLKEICLNTKERHLRLVNNYLKLCKQTDGSYDFSHLPDDDYIHYYIGHHISLIDKNDIIDGVSLDDIYFDLSFIEKKLKKNPKDLLWDYTEYKDLFQNKESLEIFESFATKHAYTVFNNKDCDIIQLGLFEPESSIIYQKAENLALKSKNKAYFQWCNQDENQLHMQNLNAKLNRFEDTKHVTVSNNGNLVACVGNGNKALVFSGSSGEELLTLSGHIAVINYCMFNNSGSKLVTASDDKTVKIFEIHLPYSTGMKPKKKRASFPIINTEIVTTPDMSVDTFHRHCAPVLCCCYSYGEDLIVSSDSIGRAYVWFCVPESFLKHSLKCSVHHFPRNQVTPVKLCCFNSDATLFGTSAYDSIILWSTETGEKYKEFLHGDMVVEGFCFAKHNLIISVANNNIYNHSETVGSKKFESNRNFVFTCCCLSPDKNFLACGTSENAVLVYNVNTNKLINNLKGHKSNVLSVMYTQDGKKLLAVSEEGYILYDMSHIRDTSLISFEGNLSVQEYLDDITIASSNYFQCLEVRKGITGQLVYKTDPDSNEITACSLSNDCSEVVYGTKDGKVKLFHIGSKVVDNLPSHLKQVTYIVHYKSNVFFTCSEDKTIKIWNDKIPKILKGHSQSVLMCVPFRNSSKLLSCSKDGTLKVWEISTGKLILPIEEAHGNQDIRYCDVSSNDKLLASASADKTVKLWFAENGMLYRTLDCESEVRSCCFSPSSQVLAFGCDSGEVRLWKYGGGKDDSSELLCCHSSCVYNIYFSKKQLLSIADDIKIWTDGETKVQTLLLPSYDKGVARPSIWASDNFDKLVIILNSVLYVLRKIVNNDKSLPKANL